MKKIKTPQHLLMHRLFSALFTMLLAGSSWAGSIDDALAAYERKDYAEVLRIVKPRALKGEAWAQHWLADAYQFGTGVVKNFVESAKWTRLAAEQGYASAQYNLGVMYDSGQGVMQDYAEAVKWYRLAAQQGDVSAQYNLGVIYNNGQGVLQDYAEAVKWYRLAAQQDKGVLQNYVKAHSWYNLSAANGTATAAENRDGVAKRMTPQQIADAQKLARDCQARQFKGCD